MADDPAVGKLADNWADRPHVAALVAGRPISHRGVVNVPPGLRIPYWVEGDPAGRRFICAHGGVGIGVDARIAMTPLVDAGWRLVTFDHRAHGVATPVHDPDLLHPAAMAADLIAVMDDLAWDRCWIGGTSMGAATSLAAAMQHPERVEGLALMAPTISDEPLSGGTLALLNDIATGAALGPEGLVDRITANTKLGRASDDPEKRARAEYLLERATLHDSASIAAFARSAPTWTLPGALEAVRSFDFPIVVMAQPDPAHPLATAELYAAAARHVAFRSVEPDSPHDLTGRGRALLDAFRELGVS